MRHPQLLIFGGDARLTGLLGPAAETARGAVRKPRDLDDCVEALSRGGPSVLALRVGRNLLEELTALERIHRLFPDVAIVVVGDADQAALAGTVWDLGARFALFPPLERDLLPLVIESLLAEAPASK